MPGGIQWAGWSPQPVCIRKFLGKKMKLSFPSEFEPQSLGSKVRSPHNRYASLNDGDTF